MDNHLFISNSNYHKPNNNTINLPHILNTMNLYNLNSKVTFLQYLLLNSYFNSNLTISKPNYTFNKNLKKKLINYIKKS